MRGKFRDSHVFRARISGRISSSAPARLTAAAVRQEEKPSAAQMVLVVARAIIYGVLRVIWNKDVDKVKDEGEILRSAAGV